MSDQSEDMKKHLTVREAAKELGIGTHYVYVLLWSLQLTGTKDTNGRWRISAHSVRTRKQRLGEQNGNQSNA